MHCFFFKFTLALNSVLLFWTLFVFQFLLGVSADFLCLMTALLVTILLLLEALLLLTSFRDADVFGTKTVS
jgi:hypothetical protein